MDRQQLRLMPPQWPQIIDQCNRMSEQMMLRGGS